MTTGPDDLATALVAVHGSIDGPTLRAATGDGTPADAVEAGDWYTSSTTAAAQLDRARSLISAFHREHPLRPGMPASSLASQLGIEQAQLAALLGNSDGALVDDGATIRATDFQEQFGAGDEETWQAARTLLAESLAVPRAGQLGLEEEQLHALVRRGDLVLVEADLVYLPQQVDEILTMLNELEEPFTVSTFRDALGLSRRQAVPLLEWLDRTNRTVRDGDLRTVRR